MSRSASEATAQEAVEEERRRLARELHDSLGYTLTVAMVQLENAAELTGEAPAEAREIIEAVRGRLKAAVEEMRRILTSLRSQEIGGGELDAVLQRLVSEFAEVTGIKVHTSLPQRLPDLSDAQATALFRAAQEALINAFRHGQAQNVEVRLESGAGVAVLTVKDDGRLLPAKASSFVGLAGMKERVDLLGGSLAVKRAREGGMSVVLRLPVG